MKLPKLNAGLLLMSLLSVSLLATTAPVSARHGVDDTVAASSSSSSSEAGDDSTSSNSGSSKTTSDDSTEAEVEVHKGNDTSAEHVSRLKAAAQQELVTLRKDKTEKTHAQRQKVCENRQKAVDNKLTAFGGAADRHLTRLNSAFEKLQAYQTEKQLPVTNYQALVDAATAKQAAATTAVAALKTVSVNIDCTTTDPASSLTVVKSAAKEARTALKAYRSSLKDIVVALAQAKPTDDSTEGTN